MTYLKKCHGPFEHVPKAKRKVVRGEIKRRIQHGDCPCDICKQRREEGEDPLGWPEDWCWVRQRSDDNGPRPPTRRPVYVCRVIRTEPQEGAG